MRDLQVRCHCHCHCLARGKLELAWCHICRHAWWVHLALQFLALVGRELPMGLSVMTLLIQDVLGYAGA